MIAKTAFAVLLALVSTPSVPQTVPAPTELPADPVARAKFPAEPGSFVDALEAVNLYVNSHMTYEEDSDHYGVEELWVMAPKDNKGDCEDYALTKLYILSQVGFPIVTHSKLVFVMVTKNGKMLGGHVILAIQMPHGSVGYLDLTPELMTRAELEAKGYVFYDWKA